jgi:hypothetical protein
VRDLFDGLATGRRNHAETLRHGASVTGLAQQRVHHLLRAPIYAGRIETELLPEPIDAAFTGLITPATWRTVQGVIAGRGFLPRRGRDEAYPLRGILTCAECGGPITGAASRGHTGRRYAYYACRRGCVRMAPDEAHEQLDAYMASEAAAAMPALERVARLSAEMVAEAQRVALARQQQAEAKLAAILARRDRLTALAMAGDVGQDEYRTHRAKVDADIDAAKADAERATVGQYGLDQAVTLAMALLRDPARLWRQMDLGRRQQLVRVLFGSTLALGRSGYCRTTASDCSGGVLQAAAATDGGVACPVGNLVELIPAMTALLAA